MRRRGRIYIPQEDLKRFGVSEEWILKSSSRHPDYGIRG